MERRRLSGTRFVAIGGSLIVAATMPVWFSACTTQPSLRDGGGSGGSGAGGAGGSSQAGPDAAGMGGASVDATADSRDGPGAVEVGPPGSCPIINDPLAPQSGLISITRVGVRAVIPVPYMIAFNATFLWTATDGAGQTGAGFFDDPRSDSPTFVCEAPGDVTLTVHVGLPGTACDTTTSWVVSCRP